MKALFIYLALLICSSLCASVEPTNLESQPSQNEQSVSDWNPVSTVQSATNRHIGFADSRTNFALLAGVLFALLIVSRRSQFAKN